LEKSHSENTPALLVNWNFFFAFTFKVLSFYNSFTISLYIISVNCICQAIPGSTQNFVGIERCVFFIYPCIINYYVCILIQ